MQNNVLCEFLSEENFYLILQVVRDPIQTKCGQSMRWFICSTDLEVLRDISVKMVRQQWAAALGLSVEVCMTTSPLGAVHLNMAFEA